MTDDALISRLLFCTCASSLLGWDDLAGWPGHREHEQGGMFVGLGNTVLDLSIYADAGGIGDVSVALLMLLRRLDSYEHADSCSWGSRWKVEDASPSDFEFLPSYYVRGRG